MDGEENNSKVIQHGLRGFIYQTELLMWYLLGGMKTHPDFKLGTEIKEAEKFDDLVFKYEENKRKYLMILQCKRQKDAIKYVDIVTDKNNQFGLAKYFCSFKIAKHNLLEDGEIKYAIIHTNTNFAIHEKKRKDIIGNITKEIQIKNDTNFSMIHFENCGKFYQFPYTDDFRDKMKLYCLNYEYSLIATELIKYLYSEKLSLPAHSGILKHYDYLLATEVIDMKTGKFRKDFIKENGNGENEKGWKKLKSVLMEVAKKKKNIFMKTFKIKDGFGTQNKVLDWPENNFEEYFKIFLETFFFATGQPDVEQLREIIVTELKKRYSAYDPSLMHSYLFEKIQSWLKGTNESSEKIIRNHELSCSSRFVSFENAKNFFKEMIRKFKNTNINGKNFEYDNYVENYKISFIHTELENTINEFLQPKKPKKVLSVVSQHVTISSIKLYAKLTNIFKQVDFVYVKLSTSDDRSLNLAIEAFKSLSTDHVMVLEWDSVRIKHNQATNLLDHIIDVIKNNCEKKLIVVSNENGFPISYFQKIDMEYDEIKDITNTLANLQNDSQDAFLKTKVNFQESETALSDLIFNDEQKKSIDGEILMKILKQEPINIGKPIHGFKKDMENYYIERKFFRRLKSDKNNLYLLSEINEENLCSEDQTLDVIEKQERLTELESDVFKREVEKNESGNIYMLNKSGDKFVLIKKSNESFDKSDFENVIKSTLNCKINLISGIAGMGKSTLFTSLSRKMKKLNPKLWVIEIDLNSASTMLNKMKSQKIQFENVIDFLHNVAKHHSKVEKLIFEQHLQMGNVVLYFDAFDEVCPNYKEVVINLIKVLKDEVNIKNIWISSRPYDSILSDLKSSFKSMSSNHYDIEPFTEDNRNEYLENFWGQSFEINEESFIEFAEILFELLSKSIHDKKHEFLGIALHTMMIGVIFKDTFENFQRSNLSKIDDLRQELLKMLKLSAMYEKFVEIKFEIYWVEKNKVNLNIVAFENVEKNERAKCFENWKILALDTLFDGNELAIFLSEEDEKKLKEIKDKFKEKGDNVGIMNGIVNDIPLFIHRTFAEYFAAVFIFDSFTKEDKKSLEITKYFLENMINQEHFVICHFIDSMFNKENSKIKYNNANLIKKLDNEKLYVTLQNKWQWIAIWLIQNDVSLEYSSKKENEINLLHFVYSQQKNMEITHHLIEIMFVKLKSRSRLMDFLQKKNIEGNTTSDIAVIYGKYNNVKYLLNEYVKLGIQESFVMNENNCGANVLHLAANSYCDDDTFTCLLDLIKSDTANMKKMLSKRDDDGNTPLNVAVVCGQVYKIKFILEASVKLGIYDRIVINENESGRNVLHYAAYYNFDKAFTCLLSFIKSDTAVMEKMLSKRDNEGDTPLNMALRWGQVNIIKSIFEESDKLGIHDRIMINENNSGQNILHHAVYYNRDNKAFTFLLDLIKSDTAVMEKMLSKRDNEGDTPLNVAVRLGQVNIIKSILEESVKIGICDRIVINENKSGQNVLHHAAVVDCNDKAFTFLLDLIKNDTKEMEKMLSKRNNKGETPLDVAKKYYQLIKVEAISNVISELGIRLN